ncbi:MAG: hypothetical protein IPK01_14600 [Acidobacteria bacterium]|nr:hypothetical protein [Acidobacteriota bacterium]
MGLSDSVLGALRQQKAGLATIKNSLATIKKRVLDTVAGRRAGQVPKKAHRFPTFPFKNAKYNTPSTPQLAPIDPILPFRLPPSGTNDDPGRGRTDISIATSIDLRSRRDRDRIVKLDLSETNRDSEAYEREIIPVLSDAKKY